MSITARAVRALRDLANHEHHGEVAETVDAHADILGTRDWATGTDWADAMVHARKGLGLGLCAGAGAGAGTTCVRAELTSADARGRWAALAIVSELLPVTALSVDSIQPPRPGGPGAVVLASSRARRLPPEDDGRRWDVVITDRPGPTPPCATVVVLLDPTDEVEAAWAPACSWRARLGPLLVAYPRN